MSTRRESREWAVQILFQLDLNAGENLSAVFEEFWRGRKASKKAKAYTEMLVNGVRQNIEDIDAVIKKHAENWTISRMGIVDRNVLRAAVYEMQNCIDVPHAVVINEAVDIAKYFSNTDSGKFVNGILDRARKTLAGNK